MAEEGYNDRHHSNVRWSASIPRIPGRRMDIAAPALIGRGIFLFAADLSRSAS